MVVGTRPEAIKLAPVANALEERGLNPSLILTGQHVSLDPVEHGLARYPAVALCCPGQSDPHAHVAAVKAALLPFLSDPPDLIVVQGDTSSALARCSRALVARNSASGPEIA